MRKLLLIAATTMLWMGCKKDETDHKKTDEYMSFYFNDEYHYYPQVIEPSIGGSTKTIKASRGATGEYLLMGRLNEFPYGSLTITLRSSTIPDKDTFYLMKDGYARIMDFGTFDNRYDMKAPLTGMVVFTTRTDARLEGTFEFDAYRYYSFENIYTDTVGKITKGKFSIKLK